MIGQTTPGRRNMHLAYLLLAILAVAALTPVDAVHIETAEVPDILAPQHAAVPGPWPGFKH